MELILLSIFIIIINLLIFLKFNELTILINFFDKPDGRLKRHNNSVSLIGGLLNLYLIIISFKFLDLDYLNFKDNFSNIILILGSTFFLIGFFDDLKNLSPNLKLLLIIFTISTITFFFPELKLELIKITFLKNNYFFGNFSFFFIVLSFALLANALNMFDGINLQLIIYTLFVFLIFILKGFLPIFFILLSICLIFLGILNFKNKIFIGDGGCYLISSLIGCTFIYQYKNFDNFLFGDEIFIILLIPAIDMLRLFVVRILKKKHPFKGDLNHLHHLVNKFVKNKNITIMITIFLCVLPVLLMYLEFKTYLVLMINLIIYFSLILFLGYKK